MAVSLKPVGRSGRMRHRAAMSDINVTPLVDVMLVLLVIFMVTAPLMTVGIPVDLPKTRAPNINESIEPLTVSISKDGKIYIQETEVQLDTLLPKVQAIMNAKPETRIFVRGDENIAYRQIMEVMGTLHSAGYNKVALLTELPKTETSGKSK
jgi:biopolymer transport protein TolR